MEGKEKEAKVLEIGMRIKSQTKIVVGNVRKIFEWKKDKGPGNSIHAAQATGLSDFTVKKTHKEFISQDFRFFTPVKRYMVSD